MITFVVMIARNCRVHAHYSIDSMMLHAAITVVHRTVMLQSVFCFAAVFWLSFFR